MAADPVGAEPDCRACIDAMTIVSVAMATHNGAAYIAEQIKSILAQTRPIEELIVSDDASSDGTVDIVRALFDRVDTSQVSSSPTLVRAEEFDQPQRIDDASHPQYSSLIVLRNDVALGVTANFEQALSHCRGDLIALSDQDDVWHRDRIARQVACFEANPDLLLLATNARSVDTTGRPLGYDHFTALEVSRFERKQFRAGTPLVALLRRNLVTGATMMIRRSLFEQARPFPPSWLHDEWLAMMGAVLGHIDLIDDCLIDYRQHDNNQVGMVQQSLADKISRFMEPRTERNRRLLERALSLDARLQALPWLPPTVREQAHDKACFEQARSALPGPRLARIPAIIRHLTRGDYARFGNGWRDAVRNLVQPVGGPEES